MRFTRLVSESPAASAWIVTQKKTLYAKEQQRADVKQARHVWKTKRIAATLRPGKIKLAAALREVGKLERSLFMIDWILDE